ncbi:type II secretion system protein [Lachnospira multipara]|uniref:Prepilin-type N-terminal cleavage/methylation domain-containing protein n=1 Tax=Lachnospira multipara TaxID=28051 RepID=A0A1H5US24_9FIRM|nr:type II secretion system protein [Lachnospira multipara]SEF77774.1 prepilin-type N-terminal cleavage/methylation domain-containing protein [Lachnospira multipara]
MVRSQKKLGNKGFSLVELIVVIAIMVVLVGVLAPTLLRSVERSRESTDLQTLDSIREAVMVATSDEAIENEVADGAIIDLGSGDSADLEGTSLSNYSSLQQELQATLTSSITMKSSKARSGNIYIVITDNGSVCVMVATTAPTSTTQLPADTDAVACARVTDAYFIVK